MAINFKHHSPVTAHLSLMITILGPPLPEKPRWQQELPVTWKERSSLPIPARYTRNVGRYRQGPHRIYRQRKNHPLPPYDIVDPGTEYNIFEYQQDFLKAYNEITSRGKLPVLCGGSGMYLESVLKKYRLIKTKPDPVLFRNSPGKPMRS